MGDIRLPLPPSPFLSSRYTRVFLLSSRPLDFQRSLQQDFTLAGDILVATPSSISFILSFLRCGRTEVHIDVVDMAMMSDKKHYTKASPFFLTVAGAVEECKPFCCKNCILFSYLLVLLEIGFLEFGSFLLSQGLNYP
ncbi:uncharacterized protein LOC120257606 [Dioscorea cayenensis subsp. rotundata]|uniref:Uncharacterized protein LOC120257606 n=1 Tax=Dioscorea cayennensis subsp. rotundata TaxID=55577 RepID=A0AB40B0U9_DIOCR|nr:uncharacterized protein LOC120257606 [Dioscorea cayenensis subsp. rotundata]